MIRRTIGSRNFVPSSAVLRSLLLTLVFCFIANIDWRLLAQSESPNATTAVIVEQPSTTPGRIPITDRDRQKLFTTTTAQVPDEIKRNYSLGDLLLEENKRLKKEIERLEKENAELRAKVTEKND